MAELIYAPPIIPIPTDGLAKVNEAPPLGCCPASRGNSWKTGGRSATPESADVPCAIDTEFQFSYRALKALARCFGGGGDGGWNIFSISLPTPSQPAGAGDLLKL